jgi:hypothetical protein
MLTNKTVSFKSIFAKIYRDLQLKDEDDLLIDILEWSAEALEQIGVYNQYEKVCAKLDIVNYKAELPCNYVALEQVTYEGSVINYSTSTNLPVDNRLEYSHVSSNSSNIHRISELPLLLGNKYYVSNDNYFIIDNNWIKTSFETGQLEIAYLSQLVDNEGFPLIPDTVSFKEAIYWYIVYKITYAQARRNEINNSFYTDAYDKWLWYCNQAGAKAMMPDLGTLENLKRSFISLKPNLYKFNQQFSNGSK